MTTLSQGYYLIPDDFNNALTALMPTELDAANYMITTEGNPLTVEALVNMIDWYVLDFFVSGGIASNTYSELLTKHGGFTLAQGLKAMSRAGRELQPNALGVQIDIQVDNLNVVIDANDKLIADATAEWAALTAPERAKIPNLFSLATDWGSPAVEEQNTTLRALRDAKIVERSALPVYPDPRP